MVDKCRRVVKLPNGYDAQLSVSVDGIDQNSLDELVDGVISFVLYWVKGWFDGILTDR